MKTKTPYPPLGGMESGAQAPLSSTLNAKLKMTINLLTY